jgi:hypothetical protein|tara:strand:- start:791 stop:1105 length:315 start_codon:yes stop_codon:yes gene_type:complete
MKYYSAIISLFFLSFISVMASLYLGNASSKIEKDTNLLQKEISLIRDQVNINEIEYNLFTSYDYLKKLQKIYFIENEINSLNNRVSFNDLQNTSIKNLYTVGIR